MGPSTQRGAFVSEYSWILVSILLLVPTLVVGFIRVVLRKQDSMIAGTWGIVFALLTFASSLWIIIQRVS